MYSDNGALSNIQPCDMAQLQEAAVVMMSANVSSTARKAAEEFFIKLRKERISPNLCRQIIETSRNELLTYEMVQVMVMNIFKEWSVTDPAMLNCYFNYFLYNAVLNSQASRLIKKEMLRSCAKLLKMSMVDGKGCSPEKICEALDCLLTNENPQIRVIGCDFIEELITEFSTISQGLYFGAPLGFDAKARMNFEVDVLLRLFEKCINVISECTSVIDPVSLNVNFCENVLRILDIILSYNFQNFVFPLCITSDSFPGSLAPPDSWRDVFKFDELLPFFFKLHERIRPHEALREHSVNCLLRLGSLMGPVLNEDPSPTSSDTSEPDCIRYKSYLMNYLSGFLDVFEKGQMESELLPVCEMVYKFTSSHKMRFLFQSDLMKRFAAFMVQFLEHFTSNAMKQALLEDDCAAIEGLQCVYSAWWVLLRNSERINNDRVEKIDFEAYTFNILSNFMCTILSEPMGSRVEIPEEEYDEDDEDDFQKFNGILKFVGRFSIFCINEFFPRIYTVFSEKLKQIFSFVESGVNEGTLNTWREDMHWLLLLIGSLVTNDLGEFVNKPNDFCDYAENILANNQYDKAIGCAFTNTCIKSPHSLSFDERVDPSTGLFGVVLAWNSIEHCLLVKHGREAISPELARTSLWCLNQLLPILHHANHSVAQTVPSKARHTLQNFVDFVIQKVFTIFKSMPSEKILGAEAVDLLMSLVYTHNSMLADSKWLFPSLSGIQIEQLPSRRNLLEAIVQICVASNREKLQENVAIFVLKPASDHFHCLSKDLRSHETGIIDLIDCFCGIMKALKCYYARPLFELSLPTIDDAVHLMSTRIDSAQITNSVLEYFSILTDKIISFGGSKNDIVSLYTSVANLVNAFRNVQFTRYKQATIDEDEKADNFSLLLDILINVMTDDIVKYKDIQDEEFSDMCSGIVITASDMLLPIVIKDELLKLPSFCTKFYQFIHRFVEVSHYFVNRMPQGIFAAIIEYLRPALNYEFGSKAASMALETVAQLALHRIPACVPAEFCSLIVPIFSLCLDNCTGQQIQTLSNRALFSLICFNQSAFNEFVDQLVAQERNAPNRALLLGAFNELVPRNTKITLEARQKHDFYNRLHKFLAEVQGILVV